MKGRQDVRLTADEAEEILVALAHRSKQIGMGDGQAIKIIDLGQRLSRKFEDEYRWQTGVFERHYEQPIRIRTVRQ